MKTIATISRHHAENIADTIRRSADGISNKYDLVELLAASNSLYQEGRGSDPESINGRKQAAHRYMRQLPGNDAAALHQVKRDAAEALQEPELLAQFEHERELEREAEAAAARLQQARQAPIDALLREKAMERARAEGQRREDAWSIERLDAREAAAKRELLALVGTAAEDSPNGSSRIRVALKDIQEARILRELAIERQAGN